MKYRNIAFVSYAPFIPTQGGIQRVTDLLCRLLQARGYKVFYFNMEKPKVEYDFPAPATFCETTDMEDARNGELYRRFLEENEIEVIINQDGQFTSSYFFLARQHVPCHIKTISVIHNVPTRQCDHLLRWLWSKIRYGSGGLKQKLKDAARIALFPRTKRRHREGFDTLYEFLKETGTSVCMLSPFYADEARHKRLRLPEPIHAIPNPLTYDDSALPATFGKQKEVLYVGRMENSVKQVSLLMDIWKLVSPSAPEWELVLLGDGPDRETLVKYAKRKSLHNVEFAGMLQPAPYYGRASILCLTSLFEGFGMVLTEAQQFGVVPIAFDSFASVHSIITPGENGELAAPFSKKEYAQKLLHLMQDAPYRERLAAKGRETVRQFAPERIADMWDALIQSL